MRTPRTVVKPELRAARRTAGVFVILAAVVWWHAWMPGLILLAFLAWALLHTRYQGARREGFMRLRRRLWPPAALVLVALIVAGGTMYGLSNASIEQKVLPIGLNLLAAGTLIIAAWRGLPRPRALEAARAA